MRIIIILAMFSLSFSSNGQTPDYFANDPKWVCGYWSSNQSNPPYIPYTSTYVYYLNGDTVIGSNTFHRLFSKGETVFMGPLPPNSFDYFTGYFLRQDNKSIRFFTNQIGIDSLLVSYDYQVGDTVKGNIFQTCGLLQDTIQKIDSILINTEYRKVFYLDSINGPVITEGIGHQVSINDAIGEFINPLCQGIGFDYFIHCFGLGTIPYWDSQGFIGNCNLNVSIEENDSSEFDVYPNPFGSSLNIKSSPNETSEIVMYDVSARMILNTSFKYDIQLPTHHLENGIYFYELRQGNNVIKKGKIIRRE